jgi:hypothetical protein
MLQTMTCYCSKPLTWVVATRGQHLTLAVRSSACRPDPKDASKRQTWLQATGSKARIVKSNQYVTGLVSGGNPGA